MMEDVEEEGQTGDIDQEGEAEEEEEELVNSLRAFEISHFGQVSTTVMSHPFYDHACYHRSTD